MNFYIRLSALFILLLLTSCSGESGNWGWYVIDPSTKSGWTNIKFLVGGFWATILVSLLAAFISIILVYNVVIE